MFENKRQKMVSAFYSVSLVLLLLLMNSQLAASPGFSLQGEALVSALRGGGFNLYFRHEATNWSQVDTVNKAGDWLSCDSDRMRQLSQAGRDSAIATGESIRSLGIPVAKVLASPYCRTVDTAKLMDLGKVQTTTDVMNLRVADFFGGQTVIISRARALLATVPRAGSNVVIVAHGNVAQAATPIYPDEGEGVVFQPDGKGGFQFIARLKPKDWIRLSNTKQH